MPPRVFTLGVARGSALERLLQSRQQSELILLLTSFFYESMATDGTDGGASPLAGIRSEQLKSQLHETLLEILRENPSLLSTVSTSAGKSADRPPACGACRGKARMGGVANSASAGSSAIGTTGEGASNPSGGVNSKSPSSSGGSNLEDASQPFILSEGLHPVPAKLVSKICDFVDMAELLRDNLEALRRGTLQDPTATDTPQAKRPRREVPDLLSWVQCFGTFMAVVASKQPVKLRQLLAYQTLIVREGRRCGGRGWPAYDTMFASKWQETTRPTGPRLTVRCMLCHFLLSQSK